MRVMVVAGLIAALAVPAAWADTPAWAKDLESSVAEVKRIDHEGKNGKTAADAARKLAALPPDALSGVLAASKGANPLAANLLRSAAETIVDRATAEKKPLPAKELE